MHWIGTKKDIEAANAAASAIIATVPEYLDGEEVAEEDRITQNWAIPMETATAGVWSIPAFDGIDTPKGVEAVETVEWPPQDEPESDDD